MPISPISTSSRCVATRRGSVCGWANTGSSSGATGMASWWQPSCRAKHSMRLWRSLQADAELCDRGL